MACQDWQNRAKMEDRPDGRPISPSYLSYKSDNSMDVPPNINQEEKTPLFVGTDGTEASCFQSWIADDRNVRSAAAQSPVGGPLAKKGDNLELPPLMETWTKEHVKAWLINRLRVPQIIAQKLYDQEFSGECLVSFDKEDLLDLDVPRAPAIQITRQVEKFKQQSGICPGVKRSESHYEPRSAAIQEVSGHTDESDETVSSDSGIQSLSATLSMLQEARNKIKSVMDQKLVFSEPTFHSEVAETSTFIQPICQIRTIDKYNSSIFYIQNRILPPAAGPSNLLDPIHEYQLLPQATEAGKREILYEFTKETFSFAASCMNSRTNGTIHFGVNTQPGEGHGLVVGHKITSFTEYAEAFQSCLSEYFEETHVNAARMCIRPPHFIQVHCEDGTSSDKWVIEVDVVPTFAQTQDDIFYSLLRIASTEGKQKSKTECIFVRDGPRSINILADPNPRRVQEEIKSLIDKVKCWASARKTAEEKDVNNPIQGNQGQRLKQLITRGKDAFANSIQVIVVTDKCHPDQLEHMDFLKEMKVFSVLEFDPESDVNGTCSFYRRDHVGNLHYPRMFDTQESVSAIIQKLNLFQQTSWVFCNGRANEESEADRPLNPNEWLKKRSGEMNNLVSFLCKPDLLSKDGLLVLFILHSEVTDITSPILETFCALYRSLEGVDNMLCVCTDALVFSRWKQLIECRCKEDITGKCIYELSLYEISSTIKKLKEPQTQSTRRFLPSTGSSSVLLLRKDEELMSVLDILCENECENTEIETTDSFKQFKLQTEEDFYRGGKVTWWNFYISEKDSLPFIKRDKFKVLYDLITPVEGHTTLCVMINLFHHPGCGGTTLAMHVLWNLRSKFRCAVVKNSMATNPEIATQVINLLTYGKQDQLGHKPVLLLVDNWDDAWDLKQCILNVASHKCKSYKSPMVIILNCERTRFPEESSRNCNVANVVIANELSVKEKTLFSDKLQFLKNYHERPDTFYAFMIMTNNFSKDYITNVASNIVADLDATTKQGRLFSFLALLNTYVNGSYMSLSLCEELVGIRNSFWKKETLNENMNPYSKLMITFIVEEHGSYHAVRFLHQMIASTCLEILTKRQNLSLVEIIINILHCDKLYKSCMGKDFLVHNIQSMLITRLRKDQGDDKDSYFSPLIEDIGQKEGCHKIIEVLEKATTRFDKNATLPQALARYFSLKEKDFTSALKWALEAQRKKSNSYITDTVGQVYKGQLKKEIEDSEDPTPSTLDHCLKHASFAVNAFKESQELAKKDEYVDGLDIHNKKRHKSYNTSGYTGEMDVIMILLDFITMLPAFAGDRHMRDKMLQFLKGQHPVSSLCDSRLLNVNELVAVLVDHERFLVSLKPRLKEIFTFFESYFTFLKPRSLEKETANERNKRKVSEHFKKYLQIFNISEVEKTSEKASKPNLSLGQEIVDQRKHLEIRRSDSFAGLLQHLNGKSNVEMEYIFKKWQFIFDKSPSRNVSDTVNFILANIVLHSLKPSSKLLKKYEELVLILNDELQKEGTHSNSTELYYLSMLLMWPEKDQRLESAVMYRNISVYVTSAKKSFHRRFSYMCPARSAIAHFFLGKSNGLKRIVSKVTLDQILIKQHISCRSQSSQPRTLNHLWQSGAAWNEPEVQKRLLRVKGQSEQGEVHVNYAGGLKMQVRPVYLGDIRSGYSREEVTFYLGFTMEGPVAYNIKYEE